MYFIISKTIGTLIDPWRLALTCGAIFLGLRALKRLPRLRRWVLIFGGLQLFVLSTRGAAELLLYPLETAHSRPAKTPKRVGAIVVLTGMAYPSPDGRGVELNAAADRFVWGLRLARRYPRAKLIFTGGQATLLGDGVAEASALGRLAREIGVPRGRLVLETRARNTRENAVYTAPLLRGVRGSVLLVTSATHMWRAVGCFTKAGVKVVPWPVDYRRRGFSWRAPFPGTGDITHSSAALHEYFGLLAYWLAGYI